MAHISGFERDQLLLLPEAVDDYVGADNPVRFIDAFVEGLDLTEAGFVRVQPRATGRPGYAPGDLLKLYIYGYLNRVRSSRRLEAECHRNIEVIWVLRTLKPDFKTIADFRADNRAAFKAVFRAFTLLCKQLDLFGRELLAVDGTRIKAVNNKDRNFTRNSLATFIKAADERLSDYLQWLDEGDAAEKATGGARVKNLAEKIEALSAKRGRYDAMLKQLERTGEDQHYGDRCVFPCSNHSLGRARLSPSFSRRHGAAEPAGDGFHEIRGPERAADGFGAAQGRIARLVSPAFDEIGKARRAFKQRPYADQSVVTAQKMRPYARPGPVLGLRRQTRPNRVQRDIARGDHQMGLVHRDRAKPSLKEVARLPCARIDEAGVKAMRARHCQRQAERVGGRQNQVNMVGHQAIGPYGDAEFLAGLSEQIAIKPIVVVAKEHALAPIASLRDVMRRTGNDNASETRHQGRIA